MAIMKDLTETSLSQARTEIASMTIDRTIALHSGDFITFNAYKISWTATGGDTSTITNSIIYSDPIRSSDQWQMGDITVRFTDNDIIRTEEEPPKTYLQLPTGKRLISI